MCVECGTKVPWRNGQAVFCSSLSCYCKAHMHFCMTQNARLLAPHSHCICGLTTHQLQTAAERAEVAASQESDRDSTVQISGLTPTASNQDEEQAASQKRAKPHMVSSLHLPA